MDGRFNLHALRDENECAARKESRVQSRESVFVVICAARELLAHNFRVLLFLQRVCDVHRDDAFRQCFDRR